MNADQLSILCIEALAILLIWPALIRKSEIRQLYSVFKDPAEVAFCVNICRWSVPVVALVMLALIYNFRSSIGAEATLLYFFYPLVSVVFGFYIGEIVANQFISSERNIK